MMTCARPEPTARVFVSHTGPDADAPCFVSPPWHRQWYCRPRLPQSLLLHEQHPHQRGLLRRQPRPMETVARPVAFRWHPLRPGVYERGVFGDQCRKARRRARCMPTLSASTGRTGARSLTRLSTLCCMMSLRAAAAWQWPSRGACEWVIHVSLWMGDVVLLLRRYLRFISHTDQDRRRERGSVAGAGSAGTGRVDGRSRLTSLELVIGQRKHWLNWFGFANQLGNPTRMHTRGPLVTVTLTNELS